MNVGLIVSGGAGGASIYVVLFRADLKPVLLFFLPV